MKMACLSLFFSKLFLSRRHILIDKMSNIRISDAFLAGVGLAVSLSLANCIFQSLKFEKIRQVIFCLKCGGKNALKNKFCWQCGQPLYPQPLTKCPKCKAQMSCSWNFCEICGASLRKKADIR